MQLLAAAELDPAGSRDGVALDVVPERQTWFWLLPGSDRDRYVIDAERGVLLRAECFHHDQLLAVEEVIDIRFDTDLPDQLFARPDHRHGSRGQAVVK